MITLPCRCVYSQTVSEFCGQHETVVKSSDKYAYYRLCFEECGYFFSTLFGSYKDRYACWEEESNRK